MHMTQTLARTPTAEAKPDTCLGCTDCQGLCAQLLDLVFVPETVLHRSVSTP